MSKNKWDNVNQTVQINPSNLESNFNIPEADLEEFLDLPVLQTVLDHQDTDRHSTTLTAGLVSSTKGKQSIYSSPTPT